MGLGAVRLAVLDPSPASDQPMHHASGRFHLTYNGEVYNYRDLRQELREAGEEFATDGDTEVVLAACARWGIGAFTRFQGMWALAFYDSHTRTGFLGRDRFGIKPLFYSADDRGLTFASELDVLMSLNAGDRTVDQGALTHFLRFGYIAHPATIYRQARRLAPGHYLEFDATQALAPEKYYSVPTSVTGPETTYSDACVRVRRALADAIVSHRVSDVPIGAFLSGGLDSAVVVAELAAATGSPVRTFAVGYAAQRSYDETEYARLVAQAFGTEHHEIVLTDREVLGAIPRILDHLGEPVGDSSIIPTSLVSQFAARSVTVALSGDGGDELFGGYWRYLGHDSLAVYQLLPVVLRRLVIEPALRVLGSSRSSVIGNRVRQFRKLLRGTQTGAMERHLAWSRILSPEAEPLLRDAEQLAACDRRVGQLARKLTAALDAEEPLRAILVFDLLHQLPADMLHKVDVASMMHSLEVRVPFLDPTVVSVAVALPSRFKIDRGLRKRVLTDAYRGRVPDAVLDRGKQGFEVPIGEYLRGPLRGVFHDVVSREVVESFGTLSHDAVLRILDEHVRHRSEHADLLFAILSLCWWYRREQGRTQEVFSKDVRMKDEG